MLSVVTKNVTRSSSEFFFMSFMIFMVKSFSQNIQRQCGLSTRGLVAHFPGGVGLCSGLQKIVCGLLTKPEMAPFDCRSDLSNILRHFLGKTSEQILKEPKGNRGY